MDGEMVEHVHRCVLRVVSVIQPTSRATHLSFIIFGILISLQCIVPTGIHRLIHLRWIRLLVPVMSHVIADYPVFDVTRLHRTLYSVAYTKARFNLDKQ